MAHEARRWAVTPRSQWGRGAWLTPTWGVIDSLWSWRRSEVVIIQNIPEPCFEYNVVSFFASTHASKNDAT